MASTASRLKGDQYEELRESSKLVAGGCKSLYALDARSDRNYLRRPRHESRSSTNFDSP